MIYLRLQKYLFLITLLLAGNNAFTQNGTIGDLWKSYNARKLDSVINQTRALIKTDPDNTDLNLLLGRSYADKADYRKSVPYLKSVVNTAANNSWQKAWGLLYLGNSYFIMQEYEKSKKLLEECINLNVTKNATDLALTSFLLFGYDKFYSNWKIKESDNIRFHFQNMTDEQIKRFISSRETAFKNINTFFQSSLPKKIDLFVWNSKEDFKKITGANIGFARPEFCIAHLNYGQTPGHEMTHVISHYRSPHIIKTGLINEGTAVYFDQTDQNKETVIKNWTKTNRKNIDMKQIWSDWTVYPYEVSYPLAGLFIEQLIKKFGKEKFLEFFKNQTYKNAKAIYGDDLDKLIREFENSINKKTYNIIFQQQTTPDPAPHSSQALLISGKHELRLPLHQSNLYN